MTDEELEVSLSEMADASELAAQALEEFDAALTRFKDATSELLQAWEEAGHDLGHIEGYPEFMPDFAEFAMEVAGMRVAEPPEPD